MSGKLPIDRVREAQDAPAIYDEHRERYAEKQAKLEQTNELAEGERRPEPPEPLMSAPTHPAPGPAGDAGTTVEAATDARHDADEESDR